MNALNKSYIQKSEDGIQILTEVFESEAGVNTQNKDHILYVLHGFGEYSGRYKHFPHYLKDTFERFYVIDLRGHGRSGGTRGHSPSLEAMLDDVKNSYDEMIRREPGKKYYFFCHSFGGLLGAHILLKNKTLPFKCAIVSSPLLGLAVKVSPILKGVATLLSKSFSRVQLTSELNPMFLSHDHNMTENYIRDRLVHSKITPRMFSIMQEAMSWVHTQTGDLAVPTYFIVAGDDKIVDAKATVDFVTSLKFKDKSLKVYDGFYHELVNELERDIVFEDIKTWYEKFK